MTKGERRKQREIELNKKLGIKATPEQIVKARREAALYDPENIATCRCNCHGTEGIRARSCKHCWQGTAESIPNSDFPAKEDKQLHLDSELHVILARFRDAIQQDRDRLYETKVVTSEYVKLAHNNAEAALAAREHRLILALLERIAASVKQHTVPEGQNLVTRQYVLNTIEFEIKQLGKKRNDASLS